MTRNIGDLYNTVIPELDDNANIEEALTLYHYGSTAYDTDNDDPANLPNPSLARNLYVLETAIDTVDERSPGTEISSSQPTASVVGSGYIWVNSSTRVAYISNGTAWQEIVGSGSQSTNYTWTGTHVFNTNAVTFNLAPISKHGINNFQNKAARTSAIASPEAGGISFIREESSGTEFNQLEFFGTNNGDSAKWRPLTDAKLSSKSANYTLALSDSGKTTLITPASTAISVAVPTNASVAFNIGTRIEFVRVGSGTADVIFTAIDSGTTTIRSKDGNLKLSKAYSGATLIKIATDEWVLVGDLKA
jgi:hypothetical protein